jgi:hypothetical protein
LLAARFVRRDRRALASLESLVALDRDKVRASDAAGASATNTTQATAPSASIAITAPKQRNHAEREDTEKAE